MAYGLPLQLQNIKMMKKLRVIFLAIAAFCAAECAFAQKYYEGSISTAEAESGYYNPSTKTNLKNTPMIIVTLTRNNMPAAKACRRLPDFIASHNSGVMLVKVDVNDVPSTAWNDKMDAAAGCKAGEYSAPMFYFISADGSVSRFSGFFEKLLSATPIHPYEENKRLEFQRLILNLR